MAQLPAELKEVDCKVVIGDGTLRMKMSGKGVGGEYYFEWSETPVTLRLSIDAYKTFDAVMYQNSRATSPPHLRIRV